MSARSLKAKGFTLVEILIVVVILGILAAIVIPQFTSASEAAKASSLVTQLQSLRSQLELYQLQHNGNYPSGTTADFWRQMTEETLVDGTAPTGSETQTFGPYLQKIVKNPLSATTAAQSVISPINGSTAALGTTGPATAGFLYNTTTGEIKAIVPQAKAEDTNLDPADGDIAYGSSS
jgi:general secretion pathway protein G